MLTDPIGDMITRIRNAHMRHKPTVLVPLSRVKIAILDVLEREGYIRGYTCVVSPLIQKNVCVELKYFNGSPVIKEIKRVSKPSLQRYIPLRKMAPVFNGLGNSILSTSMGILSDREAKNKHVGGKILLTVR